MADVSVRRGLRGEARVELRWRSQGGAILAHAAVRERASKEARRSWRHMVTSPLYSRREFIAALSATIAASAYTWAQPVTAQVTAQQLDRVRRVAIHPAIGVARVGNSRDAFFFGPEVPGALPAGP